MLIYRIDNPDHWNHSLYKKRVNRVTVFLVVLTLLSFCTTQIAIPSTISPGQEIFYILFVLGRYSVVAAAGGLAAGIAFAGLYFLGEWLWGRY